MMQKICSLQQLSALGAEADAKALGGTGEFKAQMPLTELRSRVHRAVLWRTTGRARRERGARA